MSDSLYLNKNDEPRHIVINEACLFNPDGSFLQGGMSIRVTGYIGNPTCPDEGQIWIELTGDRLLVHVWHGDEDPETIELPLADDMFRCDACHKAHDIEDSHKPDGKKGPTLCTDCFVSASQPAQASAQERAYWDDDPDYPAEDWQYEVANGDTRQSYTEWLASKHEQETH